MMMRIFLLLAMFMVTGAYANVAVDQMEALLAKKVVHKDKIATVPPLVKDLQENYYFVFIYRSNCPHCHKFAPVIKDFSGSFHIKMESYSVDGIPLEGFEARKLTPLLFKTFYVTGGYQPAVPALFLVNSHTLQAYAVFFGEAEPYQLAARLDELMQHIKEKFND